MYYQYKLAHFKGNMGHGVASDAQSKKLLVQAIYTTSWIFCGVLLIGSLTTKWCWSAAHNSMVIRYLRSINKIWGNMVHLCVRKPYFNSD